MFPADVLCMNIVVKVRIQQICGVQWLLFLLRFGNLYLIFFNSFSYLHCFQLHYNWGVFICLCPTSIHPWLPFRVCTIHKVCLYHHCSLTTTSVCHTCTFTSVYDPTTSLHTCTFTTLPQCVPHMYLHITIPPWPPPPQRVPYIMSILLHRTASQVLCSISTVHSLIHSGTY